MTRTSAIAALGAVITLDSNPIAEVINIDGVSVQRKMLDATTLGSTDDYEEFIGGTKSVKPLKLDMNWIAGDTSGQVALLAALEDGLAHDFVITFPTKITATWTFSALVADWTPGSMKQGAKIDASCTLQFSGKPTLGIGASDGLTTDYFTISESAVVLPTPAATKYDYVATVLTAITSVTVTPHGTGVLRVNGTVVISGAASTAIALGAAGTITDITITQTDTGKVAKTYKVKLFRAAS